MTDDSTGGIADLIAVTGHAAVDELESDELALQTLGFLSQQILFVQEIALGLGELGNPAQAGLERRCGVIDIVTVEAEAHLKSESVAGTQSDRLDTELGSGLKHGIPKLVGILIGRVYLTSAGTGISCDGEDPLTPPSISFLNV